MNAIDFNKSFWNYYCMLEDRFIELTRYVDLRKSNLVTSSNEIISLLLDVCSEVEILCKAICNVDENNNPMKKCTKWLLNNINDIGNTKLRIINTDMELLPFQEWKDNKMKELFWWKRYNNVKHDRINNYEDGNFESLLNAFGALYFFEMYYIRQIANDSNIQDFIDVPISPSKIFRIERWITKYIPISYNCYIDYIENYKY
jgi:hypothetical protein